MPSLTIKDFFVKLGTGNIRSPVPVNRPQQVTPINIKSDSEDGKKPVSTEVKRSRDTKREDRKEDLESGHGGYLRAFDRALISVGLEEVEKFLAAAREEERRAIESTHEDCVRGEGDEYLVVSKKKKTKKFRRSSTEEDEDFDPALEESPRSTKREPIPYEYMDEVLDYVERHPTHSLETVTGKCTRVRDGSQIDRFKRNRGYFGRKPSIYGELDRFCNEMCDKSEASGGIVDNHRIRMWALQKAEELHLQRFGASDSWIANFKRKRKVSRLYLSSFEL